MKNTPFSEDLILMGMERFPWKNSTTLSQLPETLYLEFNLVQKIKNFFRKTFLYYISNLWGFGVLGFWGFGFRV